MPDPARLVARGGVTNGDDGKQAGSPARLASELAPICAQMLEQLHYPGAPQLKEEAVEALLEYMHKRAVEIGVPLDTSISSKGFRLGYAEGLACLLFSFSLLSPHPGQDNDVMANTRSIDTACSSQPPRGGPGLCWSVHLARSPI